ncbi:MAG: type II secretion system F family protein [Roseimicrobium sp.]
MPLFHYEAVTTTGQRSTGSLEAGDRGEAVRKLARKGLQPFSLRADDGKPQKSPPKEAASKNSASASARTKPKPGKAQKAPDKPILSTGVIKLSRVQVIQFTEELCDLLTAGLQLESALHAMESRSANIMRDLASRLRERVRDGVPFSLSLHQVCPSFGELYCNLVAAGEASGSLGSILNRQARYLNQMEALRAKVTSAMIYPAFILTSGVGLGIVMITYLLPKLATLVESTGKGVPPMIGHLLAFSDLIKGWWWLMLIFVGLAIAAVHVLFQDKARLAWWHRVQLDLVSVGPVLRTNFEVQFLETMGNLLKNGLPLHRALELMRKATTNLFLRERLGIVEAAVADGGALSRALEKAGAARPLVVDMVRVGEQTGEMADALEKAAARFDRQLAKVIERVSALIQPIIMMGIAVMVGGMVWLMLDIVFSTLDQVNKR